MAMILGFGAAVEKTLRAILPESALSSVVSTQLDHVDWAGFHVEDFIFPLFLFISGLSLALGLPSRVARDGKLVTAGHLLTRAAVLLVVGAIFSGGLRDGWAEVRWLGVLQRIGLASAAAGLLALICGTRGLVASCVGILLGYWALLAWVPVPGHGAGSFLEGQNLTNYLDSIWLPGRKYDGDHDPEGLLSTLPAVATALLGVLTAPFLKSDRAGLRPLAQMLAIGLTLVALGWLWHPWFPIVKKLWTSSFVLVAGGWSLVVLAVFRYLIDHRNWLRWCQPFEWVGANPLALYLASGFGFFRIINDRLCGSPSLVSPVAAAWIGFGIVVLTARWLYRRQIFIKI
jgi:predicted acyltransferase